MKLITNQTTIGNTLNSLVSTFKQCTKLCPLNINSFWPLPIPSGTLIYIPLVVKKSFYPSAEFT